MMGPRIDYGASRFSAARSALVAALEVGDTTAEGLLARFEAFHPLAFGPGTKPAERIGEVSLEERDHAADWSDYGNVTLMAGITDRGLYVVAASRCEWSADQSADAAFVPAGAASKDDVVALHDFRLDSSRAGRDLAAAWLRLEGGERREVTEALDRTLEANIRLAKQAVADHADGRLFSPLSEPFLAIPPGLAARVAVRTYPMRPLLRDREYFHYEDWIAILPNNGLLVRSGAESGLFHHLSDDGVLIPLEKASFHVDEDVMFRPTDELRDPGLAERIARAWGKRQTLFGCAGDYGPGDHTAF